MIDRFYLDDTDKKEVMWHTLYHLEEVLIPHSMTPQTNSYYFQINVQKAQVFSGREGKGDVKLTTLVYHSERDVLTDMALIGTLFMLLL